MINVWHIQESYSSQFLVLPIYILASLRSLHQVVLKLSFEFNESIVHFIKQSWKYYIIWVKLLCQRPLTLFLLYIVIIIDTVACVYVNIFLTLRIL